jgi:hypothetical protein
LHTYILEGTKGKADSGSVGRPQLGEREGGRHIKMGVDRNIGLKTHKTTGKVGIQVTL